MSDTCKKVTTVEEWNAECARLGFTVTGVPSPRDCVMRYGTNEAGVYFEPADPVRDEFEAYARSLRDVGASYFASHLEFKRSGERYLDPAHDLAWAIWKEAKRRSRTPASPTPDAAPAASL